MQIAALAPTLSKAPFEIRASPATACADRSCSGGASTSRNANAGGAPLRSSAHRNGSR